MKKIFTFFAAAMMALTSFAATNHLYIDNQTGWEATALYAWAEGRADIIGGWPGIQAAGTVENEGVTYLDFQIEDTAFPANFIFNNNGGGSQLADYLIETAGDYYLIAASTGLRPVGEAEPTVTTYHVYVNNTTGWDAFYLYAWGDKEYFGTWPGMSNPATVEKDGVTYLDFPFEVIEGTTAIVANLIFHNNIGEGQEGDHRQLITLTEPRDYYLNVPAEGEIAEVGVTLTTYHVYVNNQTGWDAFYLYAYGDKEYFGTWPGIVNPQTVTIDEVNYLDFPFEVVEGTTAIEANLIFHNNIGEGQEGDHRQLITLTEARDYYLNVPAEGDITEAGQTIVTYHLYVENLTDWENFYVYAYGDKEFFGSWPGKKSTDVTTITHDNKTYLDFEYTLTSDVTVMNMNLIFHNNVGEGQEGDMRVTMTMTEPQDDYVSVGDTGLGVENVQSGKVQCTKVIRNGQLIIVRDGVEFNTLGTKL